MPDIVDPATRSRMMAGIHGRDTRPELAVRRYLHARGLRYRLHDRTLPGTPDVVFRRRRAVLFVHGCFWHRHPGCRYAYRPKSKTEFWEAKLAANVKRDLRDQQRLVEAGWRVLIAWECETDSAHLEVIASEILRTAFGGPILPSVLDAT